VQLERELGSDCRLFTERRNRNTHKSGG
jgi:hypothetical protein